ncbi:MAG: hypothetical protein HQ481_14560 [Alphaproteobacteria bacterium]|nr:hypothetical protein [Alphaproteobacteria bacterium]
MEYIKFNKHIKAWGFYFSGSFFVISDENANFISSMLKAFFHDGPNESPKFIVAEVSEENIDGILPHLAWEWIHDYRKAKNPLLAGLLDYLPSERTE